MREPHKFPMVLSGVMIFLLCEFVRIPSKIVCFINHLSSPFWRRWCALLSHIRIGHQHCRYRESRHFVSTYAGRAVPLLTCNSAFCATAALPRRADYGERTLHPKREDGLVCQMAKEYIQIFGRHGMHGSQLGWRKGP